MTAEERAEKMIEPLFSLGVDREGEVDREYAIGYLAAQIAEAEKKAYDKGMEVAAMHHAKLRHETWEMDGFKKGFSAAKEKAKGIFMTNINLSKTPEFVFHSNACTFLAETIAKMEPEE